jgi:hypothetical protein
MLPSHFLNIHFNIILPSRSRSSEWSLSIRFSHQNTVCTSSLPFACHMARPSCSSTGQDKTAEIFISNSHLSFLLIPTKLLQFIKY